MNKTILLASFIRIEKIEEFVQYLNTIGIKKDKIFIFKNLDDKSKLIITFNLIIPNGEKIDIKNFFENAIPIHKKGNALYTINALNKLIEITNNESIGNIDNKLIKIDWDKYQNKLMLVSDNEMIFLNITRVF